jgi:D-glycero-D-manno-heptose 1,7-bisphosphate phosphatase
MQQPAVPLAARAVFLDRDGVINENSDSYIKTWKEFAFLPGAVEAICSLSRHFSIVVVTNQSVIGRGHAPEGAVRYIHSKMIEEIENAGGRIASVYYCPHSPAASCGCRKPKPGLLLRAAEELHINLGSSYLVGDAVSDLDAAVACGVAPVFVRTGRASRQLAPLAPKGYEWVSVCNDLVGAASLILEGTAQGHRNRESIPADVPRNLRSNMARPS